ncbi:MAG TPA: NAD(P)/FAD-dependent oxidoreductase [Gaiellaceae bacterium]|nr:NAD(P)/FAD-dependent oxidoreductase [Gaiellaceae bacterium]
MTDQTANGSDDRFEVAVIGAGPAGLAMGYLLAKEGRHFTILEASDSIGCAWRSRWDSLVLFTPRRYDSLPGLPFPGDPNGYPGRDEVISYLERYASTLELPVALNSPVQSVAPAEGGFALNLGTRALEADQVVVATGPFQVPNVPAFAADLAPDVAQMHSTGYRRPSDLPEGTVLVVGGGNTGFQIAKELSATHSVHLAIGSRQTPLPQRVLGRDLFWWLTKTGLIQRTVDSRIGRRARDRDTLIGSSTRDVKRHGVEVKPRVVGVSGGSVTFEDGSELNVDAVIWATGYRSEYGWIDLPVFDRNGGVLHRRGVTDVPGLFFLGLTWQHTRGSALLGWVKDDAEFISERIGADTNQRPIHVGLEAEPGATPRGA